MPIIEHLRDEGGILSLSQDLQCVMFLPTEEAERRSARATLAANAAVQRPGSNFAIALPAALLRDVLAGRGIEGTRKLFRERAMHGVVAGEMLLDLLDMEARGERPTVAAALKLRLDEFGRYRTIGGRDGTFSKRHVQTAWSAYGSVAHFWAASRKLQRQEEDGRAWQFIMEHGTADVIAVAMDLLRRASSLESANSRGPEPLLDPAAAWVPAEEIPLPRVTRRQ